MKVVKKDWLNKLSVEYTDPLPSIKKEGQNRRVH